ncbi:hypothetical protein LMG27952_03129 [Paraburkholderia hiiakae]|uniref:Uncharacterized protein n=1 Tax=Paraburkholderia hiiakae TaxID=1081782 RepID=A0ABN7HUS8_9BURK|nr:hypothetical protein [Paraburkholderia hiiakae]CAD6536285.1 hypothetical protein LMG27952_03129 [Paraburkholderia hiiakae]
MSEIKVITSRTNTTTHRTVLRTPEIKRLIWEEVCREIGVDPQDANIGLRVELSTRTSGNLVTEAEALVIVTVHHETLGEVAGE